MLLNRLIQLPGAGKKAVRRRVCQRKSRILLPPLSSAEGAPLTIITGRSPRVESRKVRRDLRQKQKVHRDLRQKQGVRRDLRQDRKARRDLRQGRKELGDLRQDRKARRDPRQGRKELRDPQRP